MKKLISVINVSIALISLIGLSSCTTKYERDKMYDYYSNDDSYIAVTGRITSVTDGSNNSKLISIELSEENDKLNNLDTYRIISSNYDILTENDFVLEASDKLYVFVTSSKIWWDGWFYPVISILSDDYKKTYLNLEIGKENWLNYILSDMS